MNAFTPIFPAERVSEQVDLVQAVAGGMSITEMRAAVARLERECRATRSPLPQQSDAEYEARPWAKPESNWRPM